MVEPIMYTPAQKGFCWPKGLSDEKATRMLAALRNGETLTAFGVRAHRLEAYFEAHPEYAREARLLIEANARAATARKGQTYRRTTHCKYGHELSGSNLYFERNGRTRRFKICLNQRTSNPPLPTQEQINRVTAALYRPSSSRTKRGQQTRGGLHVQN
jgi:hypothetical protein